MVGGERASAFRDYIWLLKAVFHADIDQGGYWVVDVFLDRIVHGVLSHGWACPVVVHAKTAPYIDEIDIKSHFRQLNVELHCFAQGVLYAAYFGDLAANVEMNEFERRHEAVFFEEGERVEQFRGIKTEFAHVASGFLPFAAAWRGEFDADSDIGYDSKTLGDVGYEFQLVDFLHHKIDSSSHFLGEQCKLHIVFVFISVAYDERVGMGVDGKHCVKLRLGAGFKTDVVFVAMADNLLHHLAHLVHLYGIDDEILAGIGVIIRGFLEAGWYFLDSVVENVRKSQEHRGGDITNLELVDHVFQVDRRASFTRTDLHMSFIIDWKIFQSPAADVVGLGWIFNTPFSHYILFSDCFFRVFQWSCSGNFIRKRLSGASCHCLRLNISNLSTMISVRFRMIFMRSSYSRVRRYPST